jgi:hypothetical protein
MHRSTRINPSSFLIALLGICGFPQLLLADEVVRARVTVDRSSFHCFPANSYTTACDFFFRTGDPIQRQFPFINEVSVETSDDYRSPIENIIQSLVFSAEENHHSLSAEIIVSSRPDPDAYGTITEYKLVQLRFTRRPGLLFKGTFYYRPPAQACPSGCCNSWCGTGQF